MIVLLCETNDNQNKNIPSHTRAGGDVDYYLISSLCPNVIRDGQSMTNLTRSWCGGCGCQLDFYEVVHDKILQKF